MVKFFIDGNQVEVEAGTTVLKAAEKAGISIPHLCYHPAFTPEGSCRMCHVEVEGMPKLELACAVQVREGMKVYTENEKVVEARKGVLEFLLAEHPLDCPICDKAGECKLQDYYEKYGLFEGRFAEAKEKREKKVGIGKNLILDRERCILCHRCVRFLNEVVKTGEAGVVSRGVHSEISVYESALIENNYSGNLVDLCPVGAITDADFRFSTRVWFLESRDSVCGLCSRGCNVIIDSHPGFPRVPRKKRVYRVRARPNPEVNGFWICDLGRYHYPVLDEGRQERPVMRVNGRETALSWDKVFITLAEKIKSLVIMKKTARMAVILNTNLTNEELFLADQLFRKRLLVEKIYFADPASGTGDGFLLTEERTANRRGALELGFDLKPPDLAALSEKTDLLLVFGHHLLRYFSPAEVKGVFNRIGAKAVFVTHATSLDDLADFVLPIASATEKGGSFTNIEGKVQRFRPSLDPLCESLPEWQVLTRLAKEARVDYRIFNRYSSPEIISQEISGRIPFFRDK